MEFSVSELVIQFGINEQSGCPFTCILIYCWDDKYHSATVARATKN